MRKIERVLAMFFVIGLMFGTANAARASGVIDWTGHGSENLPCESGGHWVLAPAFGIDSATLTVDGASYTMSQSGQGSWSADSTTEITSSSDAYVTFTGEGDERDSLQLSHCLGGETPSPTATPTPTETPSPTDTPTPTPTETKPGNKPSHTRSVIPTRSGGAPAKKLALTGLTDRQIGLGLFGAALLIVGLGCAYLTRRRAS
jgi:hypothetical protein